jgi:hypothetical protein
LTDGKATTLSSMQVSSSIVKNAIFCPLDSPFFIVYSDMSFILATIQILPPFLPFTISLHVVLAKDVSAVSTFVRVMGQPRNLIS